MTSHQTDSMNGMPAPVAAMERGREILDPLLVPLGFVWREVKRGSSSGGFFVEGEYTRGDRRLELHFRYSLGLVAYVIGPLRLSHDDYMECVVGRPNAAAFPTYDVDVAGQFEALRSDIERHATDFLRGDGAAFTACAFRARGKPRGLGRLTEVERQVGHDDDE